MRHDTPLGERANGRWHGILPALGISEKLLNSKKHHPCPMCGGKDRFRYTDLNGDGCWICNQCGAGNGVSLVMKVNGWDFARAAREIEAVMGDVRVRSTRTNKADDAEAREAMNKLWNSCSQIVSGDLVDLYFASRGIRQDTYSPSVLRKAESIKHETEDGVSSWHPALVAKITGPDGKPANLHRTYLTLAGQKARVAPVRRVMWGSMPKGSAIRLHEPGPIMGVAEGLETALAASELFRIPVWAALNTSMMTGWEPPAGTHQVFVFGDNDPKLGGHAAAWALAHRLACAGVTVSVEIPPTAGHDWNDVLLNKRKAA